MNMFDGWQTTDWLDLDSSVSTIDLSTVSIIPSFVSEISIALTVLLFWSQAFVPYPDFEGGGQILGVLDSAL